MNRRAAARGLGILVVGLGLWTVAAPARAETPAPEAVVGELYDTLLAVMKGGADHAGRAARLQPVLDRVYNIPLMTRVAVGRTWPDLADDVKARVIAAFGRLSLATYASRFASYDGEAFAVLGTRSTDSGDVVVATHIVPGGGEPIALDYLMRRGDAGWQIADVYLTGTISELATKRSEFSALIKAGGIEGLISALEAKAEAMAAF